MAETLAAGAAITRQFGHAASKNISNKHVKCKIAGWKHPTTLLPGACVVTYSCRASNGTCVWKAIFLVLLSWKMRSTKLCLRATMLTMFTL